MNTHKFKHLSHPESVYTGLKVVGDGMCLKKSVVRDGAEGAVFAAEFLFQLQRLLKTGLF